MRSSAVPLSPMKDDLCDAMDDGSGGLASIAAIALTEEVLMELTQSDNLSSVSSFECRVNSSDSSAHIIGELMPRLKQLRLSNSVIPSLRDLGARLSVLQVLWLNNCSVSDCAGIGACSALKELYLAFNSISLLSPLGALELLEVLDLEANAVSAPCELDCLRTLRNLKCLTLSGNPVVEVLSTNGRRVYAGTVAACCPSLAVIDDVDVEEWTSADGASPPEALSDELTRVISSVKLREGPALGTTATIATTSEGDTAAAASSVVRRASLGSDPTAALQSSTTDGTTTDSSNLTCGTQVFSGNLVRNLRARKASNPAVLQVTAGEQPTAQSGQESLFEKYKTAFQQARASSSSTSDGASSSEAEALRAVWSRETTGSTL